MTAAATSPASPGELVQAAARGEGAAWDALVARYTGLLWSVARGYRLDQADAGDVVQTAWLRLLEHLDRLHDPEHVGAWLATTARRECLAQLRRSGRERATDLTDFDVPDEATGPVDADLLRDESDAALWRAVEGLSERCRTLLRVLMADPPPAYDEVSAALDMPVGSIGPTRGRCLERLRRQLTAGGISSGPGASPKAGDDRRQR